MSQCPSCYTPTLPLPASPLPPSPRCPPPPPQTPPSILPSSRYLSQIWVRPALTTAMWLTLLYVALLSDIAPVSDNFQYNGRQYSGGRGCIIPPPPTPLPPLPHPEVGKTTCPMCPASAEFPPYGRPPCGENRQGSSQSWGSWPRSLLQIVGYPLPPPCIISLIYWGIPPPT